MSCMGTSFTAMMDVSGPTDTVFADDVTASC